MPLTLQQVLLPPPPPSKWGVLVMITGMPSSTMCVTMLSLVEVAVAILLLRLK
jgi:hypothetical protein